MDSQNWFLIECSENFISQRRKGAKHLIFDRMIKNAVPELAFNQMQQEFCLAKTQRRKAFDIFFSVSKTSNCWDYETSK
jgi:hypothetical protein